MISGLLLAAALVAQDAEVVTAAGRRLYARPDSGGVVARAESAAMRHPEDPDTLMALGLARASRWQYAGAVEAYTRALALAPGRAVLHRHRGHRYISLRRFDLAEADLERAAGLDSTSFDIWYHLGLARYLRGRFEEAAVAYRRCRQLARTADDTVAASEWLWLALRRRGDADDAAALATGIGADMPVRENAAYHLLLMLYAGRRTEAEARAAMAGDDLTFATIGYGLGQWLSLRGDTAPARQVFRRITDGPYWPAFGFIAAEVALRNSEAGP
jgi:tetratricopeptide (TPR) repeat protein